MTGILVLVVVVGLGVVLTRLTLRGWDAKERRAGLTPTLAKNGAVANGRRPWER